MNLFRMSMGGGGGSASPYTLIVKLDEVFAGMPVVLSKEGQESQTKVCPSAPPYNVSFSPSCNGIWTVTSNTNVSNTEYSVQTDNFIDWATYYSAIEAETETEVWSKTGSTSVSTLDDCVQSIVTGFNEHTTINLNNVKSITSTAVNGEREVWPNGTTTNSSASSVTKLKFYKENASGAELPKTSYTQDELVELKQTVNNIYVLASNDGAYGNKVGQRNGYYQGVSNSVPSVTVTIVRTKA